MNDELKLGKYEFFPNDELAEKLKSLEENTEDKSEVDWEELLENLSKEVNQGEEKSRQ
jgi:hypothetical protein